MMKKIILAIALAFAAVTPARAQTPVQQSMAIAPSPAVTQEAGFLAQACLSNWQAPGCLKAVSGAALVGAANYGSTLQQGGHPAEAEQIKQHCAAATAGTQGDYPAYAIRSALTECVNTISDVAGKTGVNPDPNQYQLLLGPALCLSGDARCAAVNAGLQKYAPAH